MSKRARLIISYFKRGGPGRGTLLGTLLLSERPKRTAVLRALLDATSGWFDEGAPKRHLISVARLNHMTSRAVEHTYAALGEIELPFGPKDAAQLAKEFDGLLKYMQNGGSIPAITRTEDDEIDPAWRAMEQRLSFLSLKVETGEALSPVRLRQAAIPRRPGGRFSPDQVAKLLELTPDSYETLKTTNPSPAALNQLTRHTGYIDRSIVARAIERRDDYAMAAHHESGSRLSPDDVRQLDLEEDFKRLQRKFNQIKDGQDD